MTQDRTELQPWEGIYPLPTSDLFLRREAVFFLTLPSSSLQEPSPYRNPPGPSGRGAVRTPRRYGARWPTPPVET
jgi:hypothetical protein